MTATTDLAVTVWPGIEPRLLRKGAESAENPPSTASRADTNPSTMRTPSSPGRFVRVLGRGGAAFPLAVKLKTVRDNGRRAGGAVVVANGEEGEPASIKDRWLLRNARTCARRAATRGANGVGRARTSMSPTAAPPAVQTALAASTKTSSVGCPSQCRRSRPATSQARRRLRCVHSTGGLKPTDKPPRLFEEGVGGLPTMVSNVETLALIPFIARHGAEAFREQGTSTSPGTFLATITGAGRPPTLYEPARRRVRRTARIPRQAADQCTAC